MCGLSFSCGLSFNVRLVHTLRSAKSVASCDLQDQDGKHDQRSDMPPPGGHIGIAEHDPRNRGLAFKCCCRCLAPKFSDLKLHVVTKFLAYGLGFLPYFGAVPASERGDIDHPKHDDQDDQNNKLAHAASPSVFAPRSTKRDRAIRSWVRLWSRRTTPNREPAPESRGQLIASLMVRKCTQVRAFLPL